MAPFNSIGARDPARAFAATLAFAAGFAVMGCASKAAVHHATIDRGYPTKAQLAAVLGAPLPPREQALQKGLTVEEWELAGPFPESAGSAAFTGDNELVRTLGERLTQHRRGITLTESMQCYAREMGRFVARHGQLPEEDLQGFAAGRCGVIPVAPSLLYALPSSALSNDAALRFFDQAATKAPSSSELGIWMGSDGGRHVVLATFGVPKVRLVSMTPTLGTTRRIRIRGTLLDPAAWLRGYTGEGSLRFHACEPTPETPSVLPDFDMTCLLAGEDPYAMFDMLAAAPHALLGRQVLMLVLPNARGIPSTFHRLAVYGVPPRDSLLEQCNALRAQLGYAALHDATVQSHTAEALLPRYFAAAANKDLASVDFITLGMMAGWDVPGPLRDSQFLSFRGNIGQGAPSFLSQLLFFPSNRAVLLDPSAREVALATMRDDKSQGLWGILTTYTTLEQRSYPEAETALLDELDRQRHARGKPPVLRVRTMESEKVLEHIVDKLARGAITPVEGLEQSVRTFSRRLHRSFQGHVSYALALDGWRPTYEGGIVEDPDVAVVSKVGLFAAPGDHWGQYVSYFVYGPSFDVNRGSTVPKRMITR